MPNVLLNLPRAVFTQLCVQALFTFWAQVIRVITTRVAVFRVYKDPFSHYVLLWSSVQSCEMGKYHPRLTGGETGDQ